MRILITGICGFVGSTLALAGGLENSMSLAQLSAWCAKRFGSHTIGVESAVRRFDLPRNVLDSSQAAREWNWCLQTPLESILDEIAEHAVKHPNWLALSGL